MGDLKQTEMTRGGRGHIKVEAEMGVMHPQIQGTPGLPTITRRWERHRTDSPSEPPKGTNPVNNLIWGFWPPELWEKTLLLFKAMKFVVICYGRPRKWIHSPIKYEFLVLPNYFLLELEYWTVFTIPALQFTANIYSLAH